MENDELRQQVLDKMTKTCPCRVVTRARVKEAIRNGAHTVEAVAKETGATTGSCKGCRCRSKIQELITEHRFNVIIKGTINNRLFLLLTLN